MPDLAVEVWPGDFDGDGIIDLVGGRAGPQIVLRRGLGDGSFGTDELIAVGTIRVVGVGDVNGDGQLDVIIAATPSSLSDSTPSWTLPGGGDGTFTSSSDTGVRLGAPTYVADVDGDGINDLISKGANQVLVYRGTGGWRFTDGAVLPTGANTQGLVVADLDGDTDPDIAAVTLTGQTLNVFRNLGDLEFSTLAIGLARPGLGVAAADMNGDGVADLITTSGDVAGSPLASSFTSGFVDVHLGAGDATYYTAFSTPTNNGPRTAAVGDFNGDSILDVATGNWSVLRGVCQEDLLWDSISMLPGRGDGTLGSAASLALGHERTTIDHTRYRGDHHRLHAMDLNGDGWSDLLASPGAVLIAAPVAENRPPVANAGPDKLRPHEIFDANVIHGTATDPDNDWLTIEWVDQNGRPLPPSPTTCFGIDYWGETHEFRMTVRDGRGGVSTDSMTWIVSAGTPELPASWTTGDIGATEEGFTLFGLVWGDPTFTMSATGADIWGTSDAFRFTHVTVSGDFDITSRVQSVQDTHEWTKAGLMIRQSLDAWSRHASLFATPTADHGVVFQRRVHDGGPTIHTDGPPIEPYVFLRLRRQGDEITAFARKSADDDWAPVGTQVMSGLTDPLYVGLAVTSHDPAAQATATFADVSLSAPGQALPDGWTDVDLSTRVPGSSSFDGSAFTVTASGRDIWGTSDQFHYAYARLPGDGALIGRVADLVGPHEWSKAGLMIRESLSVEAAHHFLLVSEANGNAYQWRPEQGGATQHLALPSDGAPTWYRIERTGTTIRLSYSLGADPPTLWQLAAESQFPLGEALIGLAVTSHSAERLATARFDGVTVTYGTTPATGWVTEDVPATGTSHPIVEGTTHTVSARGADIWGTADQFRFVYRPIAPHGSVVARVAGLAGPDPWTKAGVMIRASTADTSAHAFLLQSRDHGLAFQRRTVDGFATTHTGAGAASSQWLRLDRDGDVITASVSSDGVTWTQVGQDVIALGEGPVLAGLAVTSHSTTEEATAVFDNAVVE